MSHYKRPKKSPEVKETDAKKSLVIKGPRTSDALNSVLTEVHRLRYPNSVLYSRKHIDLHPFENTENF